MIKTRTFALTAAATLLAGSLSAAHAAPAPAAARPGVPALLTSLGVVLNPLLQPVLSRTGPIVGELVRTGTPPVFSLLGTLLDGPVNGLVGPAGVLTRLPTPGGRRAASPVRSSGLPSLAGLE